MPAQVCGRGSFCYSCWQIVVGGSQRRARVGIDMEGASENMDYDAHTRTYDAFIRFVKFGTLAVIAIVVGMFVFLV